MIKKYGWFLFAVAALLLAAPNATIIRVVVTDADPLYWTASRFLLISLLGLPFVIKARKKLKLPFAQKNLFLAGLSLTISVVAFAYAIYLSNASYMSLMTLLTPIVFVVLSSKLIGEKINKQAVAGVTVAAIGAMVLVLLPLAISQRGVSFYPLATLLGVVNAICYSLGIIYLRKANERGVPIMASVGVSALWITAMTGLLFWAFGDHSRTPSGPGYLVGLLYSGAVVAMIARAMNVIAYEKVGGAVMSALGYLQTFVAILIPVFVLSEKLSLEMVIGGTLILVGIYIVERHKRQPQMMRQHSIHRNH